MIDDLVKRENLVKLLESNECNLSDRYKKLLKYLAETSINNEFIKEATIADNVFNKGADFNPNEDTTVRVYVSNLRKKLLTYYQNEGKENDIRIELPKGHYKVNFIKNVKTNSFFSTKIATKDLIYFIVILFLIALSAFFFLNSYSLKSDSFKLKTPIALNNPIWSHFFNNNLSTLVVIGDWLIWKEFDEESMSIRWLKDNIITTEEELDTYIEKYPNKKIIKAEIGDLPHNCIYNLNNLNNVFYSFDIEPQIKMSSDMKVYQLQENNIIYIGPLKNLRSLNALISSLPLQYKYISHYEGEISITDNSLDTVYTFHSSYDPQKEKRTGLALIAKIPGPNMENYLILSGIGYSAQNEAVKSLSIAKNLEKFEKDIIEINQEIPNYFFSVLEVSGIKYVGYSYEIKYFNEIMVDENNNLLFNK